MMKSLFVKMSLLLAFALAILSLAACGGSGASEETSETDDASAVESEETAASGPYFDAAASVEEVVTRAASEGKVGNWGL
ncbi:MAG: hypothetical protein LBE16_05935, partial [Clostridiales Family XIII bacterium]|nr:hypothetical protein [Clostridiales Family XIII bacterium]